MKIKHMKLLSAMAMIQKLSVRSSEGDIPVNFAVVTGLPEDMDSRNQALFKIFPSYSILRGGGYGYTNDMPVLVQYTGEYDKSTKTKGVEVVYEGTDLTDASKVYEKCGKEALSSECEYPEEVQNSPLYKTYLEGQAVDDFVKLAIRQGFTKDQILEGLNIIYQMDEARAIQTYNTHRQTSTANIPTLTEEQIDLLAKYFTIKDNTLIGSTMNFDPKFAGDVVEAWNELNKNPERYKTSGMALVKQVDSHKSNIRSLNPVETKTKFQWLNTTEG